MRISTFRIGLVALAAALAMAGCAGPRTAGTLPGVLPGSGANANAPANATSDAGATFPMASTKVKSIAWGKMPRAAAGAAFSKPVKLALVAKGANGKPIVGAYTNAIVVSDSDESGATRLLINGKVASEANRLKKSTDALTIEYTGLAIRQATLSASAEGAFGAKAAFAPRLDGIVYSGPTSDGVPTILLSPSSTSASFSASETGWSKPPYDKAFTAVASGCGAFATVSPEHGTSFKVLPTATPVTGNCTVTLDDFAGGHTLSVAIGYAKPGTVFVATGDNGLVYRVPGNCNSITCFSTIGGGFLEPLGVAADASGNLYVADGRGGAAGVVYKTTQTCTSASCVSTIGGGFISPQDVAVDGQGNAYVTDFNSAVENGAVYEIPSGCITAACVVKIGGTFGQPQGIAVDGSRNVYVADLGSSPYPQGVYKIPPGCSSASCVATLPWPNSDLGWHAPTSVALDAKDNVYVADFDEPTLFEISKGCGSTACVTGVGAGFYGPGALAIDASGTIYVGRGNPSNNLWYLSPNCASAACVYSIAGASLTYGSFVQIAASPAVTPAQKR